MRTCNGCKFCCWSFNVELNDGIKEEKHHCKHECKNGCDIHNKRSQPKICKEFKCPYLFGESIHNPKEFQTSVELVKGKMGNFIPGINELIGIGDARNLIKESKSIPGYFLLNGQWIWTILPLDETKNWQTNKKSVGLWRELYNKYSQRLPI